MIVRKAISFSLIFLILLLVYQFVVNYFKYGHTINYSINDFSITEDFIKEDEEYYLFKIVSKEGKEFVFEKENSFNKQKQVIKDVLEYSDDDLYCISLKYQNEKENPEPQCYKGDVLYSYREISKTEDLKPFISKLNNKSLNKYKNESEKKTEGDVTLYTDYLTDDEILILYDYKQLGFYQKKFSRFAQFSNIEIKKNEHGTIVGNFYMIPRYTTGDTFNTFVKYEIKDGFKTEMHMIYRISKDSYVNGVFDGNLYITDRTEQKQYEIDPVNEEVTIIGEAGDKGFAYINGRKEDISIEEMCNKDVIFSEKKDSYKDITYDTIYLTKKYAIYSIGDQYYKVYKEYPNTSILLFTAEGVKELKVRNDSIYYLVNDSIYRYNESGNVLLATKKNIKNNTYNIFDIYFK